MVESPLSESDYRQVRSLLLRIADLLARLENTISQNVGANARLRNLITRIDKFMMSQRQQEAVGFHPAPSESPPDMGIPHQSMPMSINGVMNNPDANASPLTMAQ